MIYDDRYIARRLGQAYTLAKLSPDESNQNGALIDHDGVQIGAGFNHFPKGVPPTQERPAKYQRIAHAEFAACLSLSKSRIPADELTTMFCPWATCIPCALSILCSGLGGLVIHEERCRAFMATRGGQQEEALENWQPAIDESAQWLRDGGVNITVWSGPIPEQHFKGTIKINGRDWSPNTLEFV
jgi:deoxycytidylate deaminase